MVLFFIRFPILIFLNYLVIINSEYLDTYQLLGDINFLFGTKTNNIKFTFIIISLGVGIMTTLLIFVFKPFVEIYLLHYSKYFFYILINFISLSSIYLIFRVYGYSRLFVMLYVITSSMIFIFLEKIVKKYF